MSALALIFTFKISVQRQIDLLFILYYLYFLTINKSIAGNF